MSGIGKVSLCRDVECGHAESQRERMTSNKCCIDERHQAHSFFCIDSVVVACETVNDIKSDS